MGYGEFNLHLPYNHSYKQPQDYEKHNSMYLLLFGYIKPKANNITDALLILDILLLITEKTGKIIL